MFAIFEKIVKSCFFLLISLQFLRVSHSKYVSGPCGEEEDHVITKTVMADVVFIGSVSKMLNYDDFESCTEFEKFEILKGDLEAPLMVCRSDLKCDDTLLQDGEKFFIFLNYTESFMKESEKSFYLMTSSPLPYKVKTEEEITRFLGNSSVGQQPVIHMPVKTLINESFGDRINITCSFIGYPPPLVHWKKDGVILDHSEEVKIKTYKNRSILEFTEINVDHAGDYQCIAYNVFGSDTVAYTLTSYKMHAHLCDDNRFCFDQGTCYFSDGQKLCECKSGFGGARCQLAEGESKQATSGSDGGPTSIQTLMLIITVAVVTTGVIILVYASVRSFYVETKYKKINPNGSTQLIKPEEVKNDSTKKNSLERNGNIPEVIVIPTEATQVHSTQLPKSPQELPKSPRERLNATSTPTSFSTDNVWKSRGHTGDVHIEIGDNQSPPTLFTFKPGTTSPTTSSPTSDESNETRPLKETTTITTSII